MALPKIIIASTAYVHTEPVLSRKVKSECFDYQAETVKNIDECTLRTMKGEFDLGEISLATFFKIKEEKSPLLGLPVFSKKFVPQYAFCAADSPLQGARDLRGKKVAVFQYWVTASLWHRWLLKHHYQVDPAEITWCPLRHDRMQTMSYPKGYDINWEYLDESPEVLLRQGKIDCFFYARKPDDFSGLRHLNRDALGEGLRFLQERRLMPITHVMALRRELLERHPWVAEELLKLFEEARLRAYKEIGHVSSQYMPFADLQLQQLEEILGRDWNAYGWKRNAETLSVFHDAAVEQGFIKPGAKWQDWFISVG